MATFVFDNPSIADRWRFDDPKLTAAPADQVAPIINLVGDSVVTIIQGAPWVDDGATATDNNDGDITADIVTTGSVDVNTIGSYTLSYSVTDAVGNEATEVVRTINVVLFVSYEEWLNSLEGNGWTDKLLRFLQSKGFSGGMTNAMYEYLKTKSSKLSHSERHTDWKDNGYN